MAERRARRSSCFVLQFCFFKQKTAYKMLIRDWSSDVCSSDRPPCYAASGDPARPGGHAHFGNSPTANVEAIDQPCELIRLRSKASCGSRALFNHGGILLRAAIHVANSAVHLLQIGGLTFGGGRNFSDQGAHFADPHDDMIQRLASPANQVDPAAHLTGA